VDPVARKVLRGHGLGPEIHGPPRLGKRDKARLEGGMAITGPSLNARQC
jgi:Xaa-Pro aminopeptidase